MTPHGPTQDSHTVTIEIEVCKDAGGELVASFHTSPEDPEKDTLFVNRGDRVEWTFPHGPWVVQPGPLSPFEQVVIRGDEGEIRGATVREDAMVGQYKALIAVSVDERVFVADPHIVIV